MFFSRSLHLGEAGRADGVDGSRTPDAKIFFKLETWQPDPDDASVTEYLRRVASFQRFCTISAYRVAGGSEERATALLGASVIGTSGTRIRQEVRLG